MNILKKIPGISHRENTKNFHRNSFWQCKELAGRSRQAVTLMLEDKTSGKKERRQHDDERRKLRPVDRLTEGTQKKNASGPAGLAENLPKEWRT
ncbi:hypothetical protein [Klebsiella pneumoniae]|uniref:hypothetical protein n=1 Tax=Klebsiella pneumoniae TaxID=573 RepID=UPI0022B5EF41|nr:hypothetical protein [Klebsiella pneumoniae]